MHGGAVGRFRIRVVRSGHARARPQSRVITEGGETATSGPLAPPMRWSRTLRSASVRSHRARATHRNCARSEEPVELVLRRRIERLRLLDGDAHLRRKIHAQPSKPPRATRRSEPPYTSFTLVIVAVLRRSTRRRSPTHTWPTLNVVRSRGSARPRDRRSEARSCPAVEHRVVQRLETASSPPSPCCVRA